LWTPRSCHTPHEGNDRRQQPNRIPQPPRLWSRNESIVELPRYSTSRYRLDIRILFYHAHVGLHRNKMAIRHLWVKVLRRLIKSRLLHGLLLPVEKRPIIQKPFWDEMHCELQDD